LPGALNWRSERDWIKGNVALVGIAVHGYSYSRRGIGVHDYIGNSIATIGRCIEIGCRLLPVSALIMVAEVGSTAAEAMLVFHALEDENGT